MTLRTLRLLVASVVVLLATAGVFYALSVALAPDGGPDVAARYVGHAWVAIVAAVLVGVVDFFVRASLSKTTARRER